MPRGCTITDWTWVDTLTRQLEHCDVDSTCSVAVLADGGSSTEATNAAVLAARRLGAEVALVQVPSGREPDTARPVLGNEIVVAAVAAADAVLDFSTLGVGSADTIQQGIGDAVRTVSFGPDPTRDLGFFAPHEGLDRRLEAAMKCLSGTSTWWIDSPADNRLEVGMGEYRLHSDASDVAPGEIVSWPGGIVRHTPGNETVRGSVAVMPGDINLSAGTFVRSPVVLEIDKDHVSEVHGDSDDAELIRAQLELLGATTPEATDAYGLSSITLGFHRRSTSNNPFDPQLLQPTRAVAGGGQVTLTFGSNDVAGRRVDGEVSLAIRQASVHAGDEQLTATGTLCAAVAPDIYELADYP